MDKSYQDKKTVLNKFVLQDRANIVVPECIYHKSINYAEMDTKVIAFRDDPPGETDRLNTQLSEKAMGRLLNHVTHLDRSHLHASRF